jgi:hypothetical protein
LTKGKREGATGVAKQETKLGSDGIRSLSNGKKERWERSGNYEVEHLEDSDQVRISLGKFEVQSSRTQNISDRNAAEKVPSNEVMPEKMKFDRNKLETFCLKMESKLDLLKRVSRRSEWSSTFALMKGIYLADLEKEKNSQAHEIVRLLAESVYGKMSKKILDFLFDYKFVQVIEKFSKVIEKHIYLKYARRMMDALKASKEGRRRSNQALNTNAKVLLIIKGLIKKKEVTHMQTAFSKVQEKATLVALKTINMMRKLDSVAKNIRHGFTLQTFDLLYVNSKLWRMDQIFKKYRQLLALERISKFAKSRDLLGCTASDISLRDDQSTKPNPPPQPKYPLSNYINRAESAGQGISNKKSVAENLNQILNFRAKNMDPSQPKESNTLENIRNELSNNPISRIGDSHNLSENSKTSFPGHFNDGLNIADESSEYKLRSENHSKPSTHQAEERWLDSEKTELIGKKEDRLFKNKMIDDLITHPDSQTNRGKDEDFGNYEYDLIEFDTFKKKSINKEDEEEFRVQEKSYPGDARGPRGQDHFISEFSQGKFENGGGSKNKTFNEALQKVKSPLPEISPENCFEDRSDSRPQLDVSKQEIIEKMNMNLNEIEKIFKTQEFMREFKTEESGRQHASEWTPEEKSNTGTKFSRGFNYLEVAPKSQSKQKGLILEEETYLLNPVPGKTRGEQGHSTMEREGQAISYKLDQKAENPAEFENRLNSSQLSNGNKSMKSNGSAGYSKTQMSFHKFFEAHQKPERNLEKSTQPRIPFKDKVVEIRNSSLVIKLKNKKEALDEETKRKSGFREVIEEVLEESKRIKHPPKQPRKGPSKMKQISTEENPKNHSSMILTKYKDKMNRIVFGDEDGRPKSGKASGISEGGSSSGKKLPFIKIKENARKISSQLAWEMRESDLQEERWGEGEMDDNENRQQLGATNRSNRTNHSGSVVSNSSGRLNNQNTDYKARFDEEVRSKLRHNSYTKKAEAKSKYSTEH